MSLERAQAWLHSARTAEGAWGYLPGGPAMGEPTLLACAAGMSPPLRWLSEAELSWARLLGPACLRGLESAEPLRRRLVQRVLEDHAQPAETPGEYDGTLIGWCWWPDTFTWVQPTAWGVLSLRGAGLEAHARTLAGLEVLRDRQSSDGGWNAGTPTVLGADLPGYLYLSGWVLLALPPRDPSAALALEFLEQVRQVPSTMNLSLAILARLAHGRDPQDLGELLRSRQEDDGGFGQVDRTALAACALAALEGRPSPLVLA
jgi:hypothetical protein